MAPIFCAGVAANGAASKIIKAATAGPLQVDVIRRRPVEALTPLLADALGLLLASRLAGPIQQAEDKADRLLKRANEAFLLAEGSEASEIGGQDGDCRVVLVLTALRDVRESTQSSRDHDLQH